jgi:Uma2 family endonuclease
MATSIRMTADDLWRMPGDGFHRYELVHGELKQMVPPGGEHGTLQMRLGRRLGDFVDSKRLGVVLGESGYRLTEDTVLGPDVSFVHHDRVPQGGSPKGFWTGPPDLAVEIISPGDTLKEVVEKAAEYLSYGTRIVWVINPRNRTAMVYGPDHEPRIIAENESLDGGDLLPGFLLPLAELFSDA